MSSLTALLLAASLAPGQAETPLAWKLKKGDTFYVRTATTVKQTIEVMGQEKNQDQEQTTHHKYTVLSADKDGMVVEQTIQKTDLKSQLPGAGDVAGRMKGLKLTYTFNAKNEVTKVAGYDKFLDAVADGNDMAKALLKATLSEETMKVGVSDVFGFLPGKAVKVGGTWKRDHKFGMGPVGDFALAVDYKLAGSDEKGDRITWTSTATYTAPKDGADSGLPFTISKADLKAEKFAGEYLFDAKTGRLKSGSTTGKLGGKVTITVMGMDLEMTMTHESTAKTTVSEKSLADD